MSAIVVNSPHAEATNKTVNNSFTILMFMVFAAIVILCYLNGSKFRPDQDSNPDLCDSYTGVFM